MTPDMNISLRDYFAAQVIATIMQSFKTFPDEQARISIALDAYAMADAMIIARGIKQ